MKRLRFLFIGLLIGFSINANAQKIYVDTVFGISFIQPPNWIAKQFKPDKKKAKPSKEEVIIKGVKTPYIYKLLAWYYKHEVNTYSGVNGTIRISVSNNFQKSQIQYEDDLYQMTNGLKQLFPDFVILDNPQQVLVSNITSYYFSGHYTIKGSDDIFGATKMMIYIPYGKYLFEVDYLSEKDNVDDLKTFESLVQSIKIGN